MKLQRFTEDQYKDVIDLIENSEDVLEWSVSDLPAKVDKYFDYFCKTDGFEKASFTHKISAWYYFTDIIYAYEWEQEETAQIEMMQVVKELG